MDIFSKEYIWMDNRYMKMCPTSLNTKEMQIKTTTTSTLTHVRMNILSKRQEKCGGEKREPLYTAGLAAMENNMEIPQEIKNRTADPTIPQNQFLTRISIFPYSFAAIFTIAKVWKQPKCPTDEWIRKGGVYIHTHTHTHTHNRILFSLRKEGSPVICEYTPKDHEGIILSKIS